MKRLGAYCLLPLVLGLWLVALVPLGLLSFVSPEGIRRLLHPEGDCPREDYPQEDSP